MSSPSFPAATLTSFAFNANRTIASNAALGVFNLRDYGTNLASGQDCTLALMATLAAAQANGGGTVVIPPNFTAVISSPLVRPSNVFIVGGGSSSVIKAANASNMDWMIANGLPAAVDPRTIFSVNYATRTVGGQVYTVFDISRFVQLTTGGGYANFLLDGNTANQTAGLRHGVLGNADGQLTMQGVRVQNFYGEGVSLWDCAGPIIALDGTNCGRIAAFHRACYNYTVRNGYGNNCTAASFASMNESFTISGGPTIIASPLYGKFIDLHHYAATTFAGGIDLLGIATASLTGVSADNTTSVFNIAARNGITTQGIISDTGASSGVTGVGATAPLASSGGTAPVISVTPSATAGQVLTTTTANTTVGWANAAAAGVTSVTASSPLASSGGTTPAISLTGTVPAANGGTGLTAPGASGNVLTSNGSAWTSAAPSGGATAYDSVITGQSPTYYWPLNDAAGSTSAAALVGSTALTLVGTGVIFGYDSLTLDNETSVYFPGTTGDYLQLPNSTVPTGSTWALSLILEFYWTYNSSQFFAPDQSAGNNTFSALIQPASSNAPQQLGFNRSLQQAYPSNATISSGYRVHVAYAFSGGTMTTYLNGGVVQTVSGISITASTNPGSLGVNITNANATFCGRIAKLAMWNTSVPTRAQIAAQAKAAGL